MDNRGGCWRRLRDSLLFLSRKLPRGLLREKFEVKLRGLPRGHSIGCRANRINSIAEQMGQCEDYLEIGVQYGFTLSSVNISNKTGVDPQLKFNPRFAPGVALHTTTSDLFFSTLSQEARFDLVFIDGLHTFKQVTRDFINSLAHLRPGGVIVIDDVVPNNEEKALPNREKSLPTQSSLDGEGDREWFGDVWKLPVAIKELYGASLVVHTLGFGPCGQSVVYQADPLGNLPPIRESDFEQFGDLRFKDYFPEQGTVMLPGYSGGEESWISGRFRRL